MGFLKLALPPGMVQRGTEYESAGRWLRGNLVRWFEGTLQAIGGWTALSGVTAAATGGPVRGMLAFKRNAGTVYVAMGTAENLFVYSAGTISDITPASFTTGADDASGSFYARVEAHTWQFDNYGEDLVACSYTDGRILQWDSSAGVGTDAAAVTNAPTSCKGVVVTPERFLVALGASGDARKVAWPDVDDITDWTATRTNQAGDYVLPTQGEIKAGRRSNRETLIWTDVDLWAMRYIGGELVYGFACVGKECGSISRHAMALVDGKAFWFGARGFYTYDGAVQPLPCDVADYVFERLNRAQASKVWAHVNSDFHEVTWYYPYQTDCDSYVTFNYLLGIWYTGSLQRTAGVDRGFLEFPILIDVAGKGWEHEREGSPYADTLITYTPFIESGPIELGNGDNVMSVRQYIPDEETLDSVQTYFKARMYPTDTEVTYGPYTNTNPTSVRFTARQVRVMHEQEDTGWRVGVPRLEVVAGGLR